MPPTDAILHEVPRRLLEQARRHLARLQAFNASIARWRAMEQRVGAPGRYEYEYRLQREPDAQQSVAWLDRFAALAREHDVDPDAIFAALGRPTLEPWSSAARAWQRQDSHAEEHPDA
jgi:glycine/D-amino acid oxidase-like deaminating enzyme